MCLNPSSATVGKTPHNTRPQSGQDSDCLQEDKNWGATKLFSNTINFMGHNNRTSFESIKLLTLTHRRNISAVLPITSQQGKGEGFITKSLCIRLEN